MRLIYSAIASALLTMSPAAHAGTVATDTIFVSTISSQSDGVSFSSYVYVAPNSSVTLQGSSGHITTGSSITASAFFGDGISLTGIVRLASTQTFIGGNTFVSSFTIQSSGQQIIFSTGTNANNISISSAGAISFYPQLHNSSRTTIPEFSTTLSTFGPCVTGSTLTITATGGRIELNFNGSFTGSFADPGPFYKVNILEDGQFVIGLSSTVGIASDGFALGPLFHDTQAFMYILNGPRWGLHSYCLTLANIINQTLTLTNRSGLESNGSRNIFFVEEIK